jgi:hypothetical protein
MKGLADLRILYAFLAQFRFNYTSEAELQSGIQQALSASSYRVQREFRLEDLGRLDFLINDAIVIETKIGGSAAELMRQVSRYAQSQSVQAVLVITSRASHVLPKSFNGKPVMVLSLLGGAF